MRSLLVLLLTAGVVFAAGESYSGRWESSQNGSGGTLKMKLTPEADVSFTIGDQNVKTKVASSKVTGDQFDIEYDFQLMGYNLRSHAKGTITGDKMKATYQTKSLDDGSIVDSGTFEGGVAK
jgi:hypothetical protein